METLTREPRSSGATHAPSRSDRSRTSHRQRIRAGLRGLGYEEGAVRLSPHAAEAPDGVEASPEAHAERVATEGVAGRDVSAIPAHSPALSPKPGAVQFKKKTDGKPEIEATEEAMGQHMVSRMNEANEGPHTLDRGIHYSYNYERLCKWYGKPELWKDEYRMGYNASGLFDNPSETGRFMEWRLKKGQSASKAIQAWLRGLTIAECNSSVVAMQIDTVRAALGNDRFDQLFGSEKPQEDKAIPDERRLVVHPGISGTPAQYFAKQTDLAQKSSEKKARGEAVTPEDYDALLKPGEWYYFYNHPKYLLKHPGGAWQGENALYMGKNQAGERVWSGLGASNVTEAQMFEEMARAYNLPRDARDERALKEYGMVDETGTYKDKRFDPKSGEFPDTITVEDILKAPPFSLFGTTRKGGFLPEAGITLDPKKVQKARTP